MVQGLRLRVACCVQRSGHVAVTGNSSSFLYVYGENGSIEGADLMGIERMHPPRYWRAKAEEFRAKADNAEHPPVRETLRRVAKTYDDLARSAEQIGTVQTQPSKPLHQFGGLLHHCWARRLPS
jgi:hypothetical protein